MASAPGPLLSKNVVLEITPVCKKTVDSLVLYKRDNKGFLEGLKVIR